MVYLLLIIALAKDHVLKRVKIVVIIVYIQGILWVASVVKILCVVAMDNCTFSKCWDK
jgi:hypothetical protein